MIHEQEKKVLENLEDITDARYIGNKLAGLQMQCNTFDIPLDTIEAWQYLWGNKREKEGSLRYHAGADYFDKVKARADYCFGMIKYTMQWYNNINYVKGEKK